MREAESKIGRVSYRFRWEFSDLVLKFQIRRTGFLNRHWFPVEWRMKDKNELRMLYEAAAARRGGQGLPFIFIRLISLILGIRFVSNLGQIGEKIGPETLTAYLGSMKGHDIVIFRRKAPGWSGYMEVPLDTFGRMAEQIGAGNSG